MFNGPPPLGLYIHLPWCEQKCPYCDFNSHQSSSIPEQAYVKALLQDLEQDLPLIWGRSIESIFIGGGTPSLFSGESIEQLFSGLRALLNISPAIEITLEANPGSAEAKNFKDYRSIGINRLSLGVQSFDNEKLKSLGRVHDSDQAREAFAMARAAGFDNINLDLMHGLPNQSVEQASEDLHQALALAPEHISHYQLTIEPNTLFHSQPPEAMPDEDVCWRQLTDCQDALATAGYQQYEVSAYARPQKESKHNLNYWHFGDYLGIGAGAHGKITLVGENRVLRRRRQRQPNAYLAAAGTPSIIKQEALTPGDLAFEFMLNASRLKNGFKSSLFSENTGLDIQFLQPALTLARDKGLLHFDQRQIAPTELGFRFLNDLQAMFLDLKPPRHSLIFHSDQPFMHNQKIF